MASPLEDLNAVVEELIRNMDQLNKATREQTDASEESTDNEKQRSSLFGSMGLSSMRGGMGTVYGAATAGFSAYGATGSYDDGVDAALGSLGVRTVEALSEIRDPVLGAPIGKMVIEGTGLGGQVRAIRGAQNDLESMLLQAGRYGAEFSDEQLDELAKVSMEQNQREEKLRARISAAVGREGGIGAEEVGNLLKQILEEIKKMIKMPGSF